MLHRTALHPAHIALGARMGEFAGYDMPLFYKNGVIKEHEWVRSHCGIFDVSHMGQARLEGAGAAELLEYLTPSSFKNKTIGRAQYTVLTNDTGGIIDDLIITRIAENEFFIVFNAGRKDIDTAWVKKHLPLNCYLYPMKDHALIAVQGRWAERVVHEIFDFNPADMNYMTLVKAQTRYGVPIYISRLGYTGEDGFEISIPNEDAGEVWQAMLEHSEVRPIGLAARDSLRLEMGYPLYGHDIDETTSPVEADLGWVIGKDNVGFIGSHRILKERADGAARKRVGIRLTDKGVAREGAEIKNNNGERIGVLTSGGHSPVLKESIGMGYVDAAFAASGAKIFVTVRDRDIAAEICSMPFIAAKTKSIKRKI
jgi:aminomethyltransferase